MALSPQALIKGLVARLLPPPNADSNNNDVALRQGRYGEAIVLAGMRKQHLLADEGSYFVAHNNQTGVTITTTAAFADVSPFLVITNNEPSGGKRLYLDYFNMVTTTAGSAASGLTTIQAVVRVDATNRYTSGGTALTVVNPNGDDVTAARVTAFAGQVVAPAASGSVRTVAGLRTLRPCVSATVADVVGEMKMLNFGGVEGGSAGTITVGSANIVPVSLPPVVVAPGGSALIHVFYAASGTPVAAAYTAELGFWMR